MASSLKTKGTSRQLFSSQNSMRRRSISGRTGSSMQFSIVWRSSRARAKEG